MCRNVTCSQRLTCHPVLWVRGQIVQSFLFQKKPPTKSQPSNCLTWHSCFSYFGKRSYCPLGRPQLCQRRQNRNTTPFPHGEALMKALSALYGLERVTAPGASCCTLLTATLLLCPCWYNNRVKAGFRIHSDTPSFLRAITSNICESSRNKQKWAVAGIFPFVVW